MEIIILPSESVKYDRLDPDYIEKTLQNRSTSPHPYVMHKIPSVYNNRKLLSKLIKKVPGVYVLKDNQTGAIYVGGAVNLYNRVYSYFMPSIIRADNRRVYRYFRSYGYDNLDLYLFTMKNVTVLSGLELETEAVELRSGIVDKMAELEQYFIDTLSPDLNVDLGMSGYHGPMSQENKDKLQEERGVKVYCYDTVTNRLLYIFPSKTFLYPRVGIHNKTLLACLDTKTLYKGRFVFSTEAMSELSNNVNTQMLSLENTVAFIKEVKSRHQKVQVTSKPVSAENVLHPNLSHTFSGINAFAEAVHGDRSTIRGYVNGTKRGLYRNQ